MPGMFRSMTTTSGASSRTSLHGLRAGRGLADDLDALLLEQVAEPRPEQVVVVDDQHAERLGLPFAPRLPAALRSDDTPFVGDGAV